MPTQGYMPNNFAFLYDPMMPDSVPVDQWTAMCPAPTLMYPKQDSLSSETSTSECDSLSMSDWNSIACQGLLPPMFPQPAPHPMDDSYKSHPLLAPPTVLFNIPSFHMDLQSVPYDNQSQPQSDCGSNSSATPEHSPEMLDQPVKSDPFDTHSDVSLPPSNFEAEPPQVAPTESRDLPEPKFQRSSKKRAATNWSRYESLSPSPPPSNKSSKRFRFDPVKQRTLKERYTTEKYPTYEVMERYADEFGVSFHKIKIWYQNRRSADLRRARGDR
ncbi:hypothetical protein HDU79_011675 [Rhizoclosmatium sp. JEL0117]|nr:hypothetical protein HDU79_011675 [Rhizoclosmatium sp. JEL0117]